MSDLTDKQLLRRLRVKPWLDANGEEDLRLNYDLNERSVVFDVGGYRGDWADRISQKHGCIVHVFEPVQEHVESMRLRFANQANIQVHDFGLAERTGQQPVYIDGDASSVFGKNGQVTETLPFVSAEDFIRQAGIKQVDLMKINIEGGEYDLLDHLLATGLARCVNDIQVQFHDEVDGAAERRNRIRQGLRQTHYPTYQFEFVWENWRRKPQPQNLGEWQSVIRSLQDLLESNHQEQNVLVESNRQLIAEINRLKGEVREAQTRATKAESGLRGRQELLDAIKRSESYRLGYLMTSPGKAVRIAWSRIKRRQADEDGRDT